MNAINKRIPIIFAGLLVLDIIFSIFLFFVRRDGYSLIIYNDFIWLGVCATFFTTITVWSVVYCEKTTTIATTVSAFLPILALIDIAFKYFALSVYLPCLGGYITVCFGCCMVVFLRHNCNEILKITMGICYFVVAFVLQFIIILFVTFGAIGHTTVVQMLPSPNNTYTAVLSNSNQGALGGDTTVTVTYNQHRVNLLIGEFSKTTGVYWEKWGEFMDMTLDWQDDDTLLINGTPYDIP